MDGLRRIWQVLVAPTAAFRELATRPAWALALVLLVALSGITTMLAFQRVDPEALVDQQIRQGGREMTQEQRDLMIESMTGRRGQTIAVGATVVAGPLVYAFVAVVFWVLFKLLGGELTYRQSLSVTVHSLLPWAVAAVLSVPVILGASEITLEQLQQGVLRSNLAFLAAEDTAPAMTSLLGSFDFFSLWSLVLLVIGYRVVGRLSRGAALGGVLSLWLVYLLGKMGWIALISGGAA